MDAVAPEPGRLLEVHQDQFLDSLQRHHEATIESLGALARRELLDNAGFLNVSARLARFSWTWPTSTPGAPPPAPLSVSH